MMGSIKVSLYTTSITALIFFQLAAANAGATCFRPQDMSNAKAVDFYVACRKKLEAICSKNDKLRDCTALKKPVDLQKRYPLNVADIDPQTRCTIYRDGSYRCLQDPVRFVSKQRTNDAPISVPTPEQDLPSDGSGGATGTIAPAGSPPQMAPPASGEQPTMPNPGLAMPPTMLAPSQPVGSPGHNH